MFFGCDMNSPWGSNFVILVWNRRLSARRIQKNMAEISCIVVEMQGCYSEGPEIRSPRLEGVGLGS